MWKIREILPVVAGNLIQGDPACVFQRICLDSRQVQPGDLFLALPGTRHDGHDFIPDAVQRGATAVMVQRPVPVPSTVAVIQVAATLPALHALARAARRQLQAQIIAITGSAGKTTTKTLIGQVLSFLGPTFVSPGNLNSTTGLPLSLFHHAHPAFQFWVQELGINQCGEMKTLGEILRPHVAVILNAYPVHLEGLKRVAVVAQEKAELVRHLEPPGVVVSHGEIPELVDAIARNRVPGTPWIRYGSGPACPVHHETWQLSPAGVQGVLRVTTRASRTLSWSYPRPLPWLVDAVAATAALLLALDQDLDVIRDGLRRFVPPPHRGQIHHLPGDIVVVDDSYNSNPRAVLQAIRYLDAYPDRRACLVLGDMLELGDQSEELHRQLARELPWSRIAMFVGVGPRMRVLCDAVAGQFQHLEVLHFPSTEAALAVVPARVQPGDLWLVKGSRGVGLDRLVAQLCHVPSGGLADHAV